MVTKDYKKTAKLVGKCNQSIIDLMKFIESIIKRGQKDYNITFGEDQEFFLHAPSDQEEYEEQKVLRMRMLRLVVKECLGYYIDALEDLNQKPNSEPEHLFAQIFAFCNGVDPKTMVMKRATRQLVQRSKENARKGKQVGLNHESYYVKVQRQDYEQETE